MKRQKPTVEETSLGSILVRMGACDKGEVSKAAAEQAVASEEKRIGVFLIADGVITREALEAALSYQCDLRSSARHRQAIAEAKIAQHDTNGVVELAATTRKQVSNRVAHLRRRTSGIGHPAVTGAMLAKTADE